MNQDTHNEGIVAAGLDEDAWMNLLRKRLVSRSDGPKHENHLIYRVHSDLRKGNASCYEPSAISIGPYHHGKKHLLDTKTYKERYFRDLLSRNDNEDVTFENLVNAMKKIEKRVRGCYQGKIKLKSNDFIEMMLLDGCFIVEFLIKYTYGPLNDLFDCPPWRRLIYGRDLLLLENQLPFFLLHEIFKVAIPSERYPLPLVTLSLNYLKIKLLTKTLNEEVLPMALENVYHLLHLWHTLFIPFPAKQPQDSIPTEQPSDSKIRKLMHLIRIPAEQLQDSNILKCNNLVPCLCMCICCKGTTQKQENPLWIPDVTQLEEAGVKFKPSNSNLLDIKFSKGEMIIPTIYVEDFTETELRNLVAFEQCCQFPSDLMVYFSCYVRFLDFLINTSKDVEILHKKGILTHGLGEDEEVARLFNKLNKGIAIRMSKSYLADTIKRINNYRSKKIHKWRASLARDYFYSPWAVLSFLAAIVALTLTAISAMYSIKSFNNDLRQPK